MSELVTIAIADGVADVRLNRPEKHNALSPAMFQAIIAAGDALAGEQGVRAVVLSGNGRSFCAGLDFSSFQGMGDRPAAKAEASNEGTSGLLRRNSGHPENHAQRPAMVWKRLQVPVIAAIHGVAYGGGCQIALGADIRIAAPTAKLSVMEIKWGLIPDMSITQTLRDLMPLDRAKRLTFTGEVLDGSAALAAGLVTELAEDPLAAALALAREIAGKSPDAIRFGKHLLEQAWHADERSGLELEARLQSTLIGSSNQLEAIKANFDQRPPAFIDGALPLPATEQASGPANPPAAQRA